MLLLSLLEIHNNLFDKHTRLSSATPLSYKVYIISYNVAEAVINFHCLTAWRKCHCNYTTSTIDYKHTSQLGNAHLQKNINVTRYIDCIGVSITSAQQKL